MHITCDCLFHCICLSVWESGNLNCQLCWHCTTNQGQSGQGHIKVTLKFFTLEFKFQLHLRVSVAVDSVSESNLIKWDWDWKPKRNHPPKQTNNYDFDFHNDCREVTYKHQMTPDLSTYSTWLKVLCALYLQNFPCYPLPLTTHGRWFLSLDTFLWWENQVSRVLHRQ